jgi:hypothetical protein
VIDVLSSRKNVTVFYGHIHQEHHQQTGQITHHAARSLIFALPAPGSVPAKAPLPWNPAAPFQGLGYRRVSLERASDRLALAELPVASGDASPGEGRDIGTKSPSPSLEQRR